MFLHKPDSVGDQLFAESLSPVFFIHYHIFNPRFAACGAVIDAYSQQQREFDDWITNALNCGIKEFEDCARTYRTLRKEILNALKYGLTNDSTEGFNYKIKILKRSSHGI